MLVPDNIHPEQTVYYNGARILKVMQREQTIGLLDLFERVRIEQDISLPVFLLCLDWLFLLNLVVLNTSGMVERCF